MRSIGKGLFWAFAAAVSSVAAADAQPDWLAAGRRMLPVPVQGQVLKGRAPQGPGAPFRVLDGAQVLWEGKAGESFEVTTDIHPGRLYLYSAGARNLDWQELSWSSPQDRVPVRRPFKYDAAKEGVLPNGKDAGPALRKLLSRSRSLQGATITFPKGEYHFYPEGALEMSCYLSNHDQQDVLPVGVPLVNLGGQRGADFTLEGNGSTFVFHGKMQPFLIMDSSRVTLRNIAIRYADPNDAEGEITEIKDGMTTLKFSPKLRWKVEGGRFRMLREGGEGVPRAALGFEKSGPMVAVPGGGDKPWTDQAEQVGANEVRFHIDAAKHGFRPGHVLVLRNYARPHPAMAIYRAKRVTLENVIFRDSQGMALLAQRSEDITIRGGGCIAGKGRVHTASADATHFSNCRGKILTEGALYEGMMDDAINVHSTCLAIDKVESPTQIIARYVHRQAVGFEVFRPGEQVQFIMGKTLENHPTLGKAAAVEKLDETHLRITLQEPLPEGVGQGDAVENADWYPSVTFRNNTVRYNRARGCLFTTTKTVLVEGCRFIRSHGTAILLAGDAQGWYESGRCQDVTIRRNLFDHNLTAGYQFCEAIISIYPEVRRLGQQQEPYHRHITIEDNIFRTHRVPLLYARSADDIIWRNNKVTYDDKFPARRNGEPFIFDGPKPKNAQIPEKP